MVVQIPIAYLMIDTNVVYNTMSYTMAVSLVSNGLFFHGQTYTAYGLMGYISPVTHRSVPNIQTWSKICVPSPKKPNT